MNSKLDSKKVRDYIEEKGKYKGKENKKYLKNEKNFIELSDEYFFDKSLIEVSFNIYNIIIKN